MDGLWPSAQLFPAASLRARTSKKRSATSRKLFPAGFGLKTRKPYPNLREPTNPRFSSLSNPGGPACQHFRQGSCEGFREGRVASCRAGREPRDYDEARLPCQSLHSATQRTFYRHIARPHSARRTNGRSISDPHRILNVEKHQILRVRYTKFPVRKSLSRQLIENNGSSGRTRTCNPSVNSRMLYH